jgi:hypothetical protein
LRKKKGKDQKETGREVAGTDDSIGKKIAKGWNR